MVYVLNQDGKHLMPTKRHGKVRHLLKEGKARVVKTTPFFQIQLLYDAKEYIQDITLKVDSGYTYIGMSAVTEKDEILSVEAELLDGMKGRIKECNRLRHLKRQYLRHRAPRFDNRRRHKGWLPPSLQHKYESHIRLINIVKGLLPITKTIVEVATFDTQKIKNPDIQGIEYQEGRQKNFWNTREYVLFRDEHKCQCPGCKNKDKNPILRVHHFKYWKGPTTDNPDELITVCNKCHTSRNHEKGGNLWGWEPKLSKTLKEAAFMTVIRWRLVNELKCEHTYGFITKSNRIELKLPKSHANDAFCVESTNNQNRCETIYIKQIRRNNRALESFYDAKYIDTRTGEKSTGKKLFSGRTTRNKNKNSENLHKYRGQKLKKGYRRIKRQRYDIKPGDTVLYKGQKYFVKGMQNEGAYIKLDGLQKVPRVTDIKLLYYAKGFVNVTNSKKENKAG